MVDYWSLIQALKQNNLRKCEITYFGLDIQDWTYQFEARKRDDVWFEQENAANWLNELPQLDFDIYMFPKSISEFSNTDFELICQSFQNKDIAKDNFHLLISLRVDRNSMARDIARTNKLMSAIHRNGFCTQDKYNRYTSFTDETKGIRYYDGDFILPKNVINIIKHLNKLCNNYIENGTNCNTDCEVLLTRWPVLKPTTIRYQVISFERGN